jgi:signal transduction histidine kinase
LACLRILGRNAIPSISTNIVLSGLVAVVAWFQGLEVQAIVWFAVGTAVNLVRIALTLTFKPNREISLAKVQLWQRLYTLLAALSGSVWGAVGFLFIFPDQPNAAMFFTVIVAGITAGAVSSSSPHFPALALFLAPVLLPLALAFALRQEPLFYVIAGTLVMYLVMLLFTGKNISLTLRQSLESRYRQESLVDDLVRARDAADAANRAKTGFLSSISQEIRAPLNDILSTVRMLRQTDLNQYQRGRLDNAWKSCNALDALIGDILDMGRIEDGTVEIETVPFDLRELVDRSREVFEKQAAEKNLAFTVESSLGPAELVEGDPTRIRQVLWNLLSNAIRFTPMGSVALSIGWIDPSDGPATETERSVLRIRVADTGVGIGVESPEVLFDPLLQSDASTSREFSGSGLGLSIVKNLLDLMHGEVSVTSEFGQGNTFTVLLPLVRLDPDRS